MITLPDSWPAVVLGSALTLAALAAPTFLLHVIQRPRRYRRAGHRSQL